MVNNGEDTGSFSHFIIVHSLYDRPKKSILSKQDDDRKYVPGKGDKYSILLQMTRCLGQRAPFIFEENKGTPWPSSVNVLATVLLFIDRICYKTIVKVSSGVWWSPRKLRRKCDFDEIFHIFIDKKNDLWSLINFGIFSSFRWDFSLLKYVQHITLSLRLITQKMGWKSAKMKENLKNHSKAHKVWVILSAISSWVLLLTT